MRRFLLACGASLWVMTGAWAQSAGIGVQVARMPEGLRVMQVMPGGPADRAGLRAGDLILAVDDKPVFNYDDQAAVGLIRGSQGTTVRLALSSAGGMARQVSIRRAALTPTPPGGAPLQPPEPMPAQANSEAPPAMPLQSEHPPARRDEKAAKPGAAASPANLAFMSWTDPAERGFRIEVPQGWRVSGGTHWKGQTDARQFVRVQSPDGSIKVFVDDPEVLPRTVPHTAYQPLGREGSVIQLPSGPTLLQRFLTGSQFAQEHVREQLCRSPQFAEVRDDAALSARMTEAVQPFARERGASARVSTGQAGFFCGSELGFVAATTVLATSMNGPIQPWGVIKLYGFSTRDPGRAVQARYVMERMVQSMRVDPAWEQAYNKRIRDVTGATIKMQNAVSEQVQRRSAENAAMMARLNHPNEGVGHRSAREGSSVNTTLGTRDICDALGRCKNVSNDHDNYFMDHAGNVAVGRAGGAPPDNSGVWSPTYTR